MSPEQDYFVDTWSTVGQAPVSELRRVDGTKVKDLGHAEIGKLAAPRLEAPEEFTVKAADGSTDLYGALYKPFDFDAARKYRSSTCSTWATSSTPLRTDSSVPGWATSQALTQLGSSCYVVDGRGTRGGARHSRTSPTTRSEVRGRRHVAALRQLAASRPWMDTSGSGSRILWGGYYTIRAMLTAPDVFKVGFRGVRRWWTCSRTRHRSSRTWDCAGESRRLRAGVEHSARRQASGELLMTIGTSDVNVSQSPMRWPTRSSSGGKHFAYSDAERQGLRGWTCLLKEGRAPSFRGVPQAGISGERATDCLLAIPSERGRSGDGPVLRRGGVELPANSGRAAACGRRARSGQRQLGFVDTLARNSGRLPDPRRVLEHPSDPSGFVTGGNSRCRNAHRACSPTPDAERTFSIEERGLVDEGGELVGDGHTSQASINDSELRVT
jgi:hypothetical protein